MQWSLCQDRSDASPYSATTLTTAPTSVVFSIDIPNTSLFIVYGYSALIASMTSDNVVILHLTVDGPYPSTRYVIYLSELVPITDTR